MPFPRHIQLSLVCNQPSLVYLPDLRDYHILKAITKSPNRIYFDIVKYHRFMNTKENNFVDNPSKRLKSLDFFMDVYKPNIYHFISTFSDYIELIRQPNVNTSSRRVIIIYVTDIFVLDEILSEIERQNPLELYYRMFTRIPLFYKSFLDSSFEYSNLEFLYKENKQGSKVNRRIENIILNNEAGGYDTLKIINELSKKSSPTIYVKKTFYNKIHKLNMQDEYKYLNNANIIVHEEEIQRLKKYYEMAMSESRDIDMCIRKCTGLLNQFNNRDGRFPIDSLISYIGNSVGRGLRYFIPQKECSLVIFPEYIPVFTKEFRLVLDNNLRDKLIKRIGLEIKYTKQWAEHELNYKEEIKVIMDPRSTGFNKENIYGICKAEELQKMLLNEGNKEVFQAFFINPQKTTNHKNNKEVNEVRNISIEDIKTLLNTPSSDNQVKVVNKNTKGLTASYTVNSSICFYKNNTIFNEVTWNTVFKDEQIENRETCQISPNTIKIHSGKNKNRKQDKARKDTSLKLVVDDIQKVLVLKNTKREYKCIKEERNSEFIVIIKLNKLPSLKNKGQLLSFEDTVCFFDAPDIIIYCEEDMILGLLKSGITIFLESIKGVDINGGVVCTCKGLKTNEHEKYLSNSDIIKYYTLKEFNIFYLLLCVISNNNNLFLYAFSNFKDIEFQEDFLLFIINSPKSKRTYKNLMNKYSSHEKISYGEYHRSLTIYANRIEYNITFDIITSRVLTMYDSDYFIKCNFEMPDNHFVYKRVLESFRTVLLGGIRIRNRVYKVLAASANQIRENCLWFFSPYKRIITLETVSTDSVTPYTNNDTDRGDINNSHTGHTDTNIEKTQYLEVVDNAHIIKKLGHNFPEPIGTKIIRIGLNFSNVFSYKHVEYKLIEDIFYLGKNREVLISDGIGRISFALLISSLLSLALHKELNKESNRELHKEVNIDKQDIQLLETPKDIEVLICRVFKVNYIPCALQIRIGGFKGVVCLYPYKSQIDLPYLNEMVKVYKKALRDNKRSYINSLVARSGYVDNEVLVLRRSMKKYDSDLKYLDIVGISRSIKLCLNVQIIVLLEEMGGAKYIYSNFSKYFFDLLENLKDTKINSGFLLGNIVGILLGIQNNNLNTHEQIKFLKNLMQTQEKFKIPIFGRMLMGVLDEFDILEADEVFIQLSCICSLNNKTNKQLCDSNCKRVILGDSDCYLNKWNVNIKDIKEVLVYRNPLHRFSDIQRVKCVNKKQLRHLQNVIVFSSKLINEQTVFQNCSGGDLDGDYYSVIFDKDLVGLLKDYEYKTENIKDDLQKDMMICTQEVTSNGDTEIRNTENLENFVVRNFQANRLGILSSIYNKLQDKYHSKHPDVHFLIKKIENEVDSFKKGPTTFTYQDLYKLVNITDNADIFNILNNTDAVTSVLNTGLSIQEASRQLNDVIIDDYKVTEVLIEVNRILKQPKYEIPVNYGSIHSLYREEEYRKVYNKKGNTKYYNSGKILNQINDIIHFLFDSYLINYFINKYDFMILFTFQRFLSLKVCKIFKLIGILQYSKDVTNECLCSPLLEIYNENKLITVTVKSIDEYFFSDFSKKSKAEMFNHENFFYVLLNRIKLQSKREYQQKANIEKLTFEWPKKTLKNLRIFLIDRIDSMCFKDFEFSQIDNFFFANVSCIDDMEFIRDFKDTLKKHLWKIKTDDIVGLFLYALINGFTL